METKQPKLNNTVNVVAFKNWATVKVNDQVITKRFSEFKNIDGLKTWLTQLNLKGDVTLSVNTQWLSAENRAFVNSLLGKIEVKTTQVYPTEADVNYAECIAWVSRKKEAHVLSKEDLEILAKLVLANGKSSIKKALLDL